MPSDRSAYNITPPRDLDNHHSSDIKHFNASESSTSTAAPAPIDTTNVSEIAKLMRARLQYAQIKLQTGMSTEDLQQIERAFLCSPRQPRRPLPSEFPPTPASSSPHSRRVKRLLLSAMTPTQNSWRKKKKIREQKKNELFEDEAAARTILMLSSSSSAPRHQTNATVSSSPPYDNGMNSTSSGGSVSSGEETVHRRSSLHMYKNFDRPNPSDDIYDAVSNVPDYEEQSRRIGKSLSERPHCPPPPAIAINDSLQQVQYDRPLPSPHYLQRLATPTFYKPPPPPMFGRPLAEDPFYSKPIIHENVSSSRHNTTPPSSPLPKK
ncbi:hypothetical protein [Parasitella parasitica]|uniref:Uncharacterized protein n=1 Tax=Parasitella parasitica TaxID=35722 RepID=A0A0B7N8X7_9FUNG|nr:hypothetical protein [Parasitella parasitica]